MTITKELANRRIIEMAIMIAVKYKVHPKRAILAPIQPYDKDSDGRPDYICQKCGYPKACCACSLQTKKTEQTK